MTPPSNNNATNINNKDSITNQTPKAFSLGNIISEVHSIRGINILPKPPINIGIIMKNIINNPWKVILELYWIDEHIRNPGNDNSTLIIIDSAKPIDPPITPNTIYNHPI